MAVYVIARTPLAAQEAIDKYASDRKAWVIVRTIADLPPLGKVTEPQPEPTVVLVGEWYWKHPSFQIFMDAEYFSKARAKMVYSEDLE